MAVVFISVEKNAACCALAFSPVHFLSNEKLQQAISDYYF